MTVFEFMALVSGLVEFRSSKLRLGQQAFCDLYVRFPEIGKKIDQTEDDPFYDDAKLKRFLQRILKDFVEE